MLRSIRWRLTASYVVLALLTASTVGLLSLYLIGNYARNEEKEYLIFAGRVMVRQFLTLLSDKRSPQEIRRMAEAAGFLSNVRIRILDRYKQLIVDSGSQNAEPRRVWPGRGRFMMIPNELFRSLGGPDIRPPPLPRGQAYALIRRPHGLMGHQFFLESIDEAQPNIAIAQESDQPTYSRQKITLPIGDKGRTLGFLELSQGPDLRKHNLAAARNAIVLAAAGAALIGILIGLFMSKRLTKPLIQLTSTVSAFNEQNLHIRVPEQGQDEIGQLARKFNRMAERLENSFQEIARERDSLKQFAADASHELRTPLTALKTYNELLQSRAGEDPVTRQEFLAESQTMLERLEWIVRNLLDLSRYDTGLYELNLHPHSPAEIARSALNALKERITVKKIELNLILEEAPPEIHCDRERLEMALINLLDNSLKVLPPGGRMDIGVQRKNQDCLFRIKDNGPGIAAEDLPHIFNRFYRSRRNTEPGSGLGLAIVRSVTEAHGGEVEVISEQGRGSEFILRLPIAPIGDKNNP